MLIYEENIKSDRAAFVKKVRQIAAFLKINPNWLMAVMYKETGGTFSPSIVNRGCLNRTGDANQCATGLIQFMPFTAKALGTTVAQLRMMSAVAQLDFVFLFYKAHAGKLKSLVDLYLVTFYPYALGKSESYRFGSEVSEARAKLIVAQNPIDFNKDGYITLSDFRQYVYAGIDVSRLKSDGDDGNNGSNKKIYIGIALVGLIALYNAFLRPKNTPIIQTV
jgi:hypothetical protein